MVGDRGRLTPADVVHFVAVLAFVGPLYVVFQSGLDANAGLLSTGEAYLFQLVLPSIVLVILSIIYVTAVGGGVR